MQNAGVDWGESRIVVICNYELLAFIKGKLNPDYDLEISVYVRTVYVVGVHAIPCPMP